MVGLSEVHLTLAGQLSCARRLWRAGWGTVWGPPSDALLRSDGATSSWFGASGRVALLAPMGVPLRLVDPSTSARRRFHWASRRWVHGVVGHSGHEVLHVMVIYGFTSSAVNLVAHSHNERLLREVFSEASLRCNARDLPLTLQSLLEAYDSVLMKRSMDPNRDLAALQVYRALLRWGKEEAGATGAKGGMGCKKLSKHPTRMLGSISAANFAAQGSRATSPCGTATQCV